MDYVWRNTPQYEWTSLPVDGDDTANERVSAFTVAELVKMLPKDTLILAV
jgi:hypothetical protein